MESNPINDMQRSDVAAVGKQLEKFHEFSLQSVARDGRNAQFAVVPAGKAIVSLKPFFDELREKPDRRRGTATIRDLKSFIEFVERFKSDNTALFANPDKGGPSLTAVFDYHPHGGDATVADWSQHRAVYAPQLSDEWKVWTGRDGTSMAQADFAAFVDDRIRDLIVPALDDPKLKTFADLVQGAWATPSDMVKLSRSLQVNVESVVKNAQTLNSGEVSIIFEEVHKDGAGAPLRVPNLFTIAIPVFYGGELYRIAARLRYRVNNAKISWSYQLVRPDLVFDDALNEIIDKASTDTSLPLFLGAPEK
jgi:uncharacterized protein YfdQ (DUF2303 family)